ncbi:MAG: ZIP family metal transporter [Candidatus Micrarchaeia archaeon]|jgi:zinc and cadmium transporter
MMLFEIVAATLFVSLLSLLGAALFFLGKKSMQTAMFLLVGFSTGAILGAAFFDLLPESIGAVGAQGALAAAFAGMVAGFVMEKVIHLHHHHHVDHAGEHKHPLGPLMLAGGAMHSFFDGVAIAAGFMAGAPVGITTTIAVIFHELPHGIGNFSLLLYSGYGRRRALLLNFLTALSSVAGGLLFYFFANEVKGLEAYALAFTAGTFIYIASADLFPELHKEKGVKGSLWQLACILSGALLIWLLASTLGA